MKMDDLRADAIAARSHLVAHGWIPRNSESFRHLPPPDASLWLGSLEQEALAAPTGWRLDGAGAHVQAQWLDATDPAQRRALLEDLPPPGALGEAAPFAWAHRALVRDGLRLRVGPAPDEALTVLRLARETTESVEAPLLAVELLPGARCVLVETHDMGQVVQNLQVQVMLGAGAQLWHARVVRPPVGANVAHHVQVHAAEAARYDQRLLASGAAYHLQRTLLDLDGAGASASARGVLLAADAALEQQVRPRHAGAHTQSAVEMLALASGSARIVAHANSLIAAGSDGADARQRLAGIPTAGQPKLVLRPHLEIHHDNVQAAHGATWGALPEDALFLARQRGLGEAAAKALIIEGLARAVLMRGLDAQVEIPQIDAALAAAVADHLAGVVFAKERRHG